MCNTEFDDAFAEIEGLMWYPWVGEYYLHTRTVILGESVYEDGDEWLEGNKDSNRILVAKRVEGSTSRLFSKTEQAFLNKAHSTNIETVKMWNSVIFWNMVQKVLSSRKERPTLEDKVQGWKLFFKLADIIKPNYCIVLGQHSGQLGNYLTNYQNSWHWNKEEFYAKEKVINLSKNDNKLKIVFINHPSGSRGFKWDKWGELLKREIQTEYSAV